MATPVLTQGTIEYLELPVVDSQVPPVITTLVGTTPLFDVKGSTGFLYYTNQAAVTNSATPMLLYCLIDTTTSPGGSPSAGGVWVPGNYILYFKLTTPPGAERPRLGPYTFTVQL